MSPLLYSIWTFGHWFGNAVNLVGACVLLSRIALHVLPKPTAGQTGWYPALIAHLWAASLTVGKLESQI